MQLAVIGILTDDLAHQLIEIPSLVELTAGVWLSLWPLLCVGEAILDVFLE